MAAILPIPSSRVSDLLASQRIVQQLQSDQRELFRVQTQLSTGRRIISPSDDAPAALRAMNLQRILERKTQAQTTLGRSVSVLSAGETALGSISTTLNDMKAAALGVDNSISTNAERLAVANDIDRAIQQLVDVANSQSGDRYLFSGSRTLLQPYDFDGKYIVFNGNEEHLRSYVDQNYLFETNIPGGEAFGGLSAQVQGSVDFNPQLNSETQLSHLNGGEGITSGAVEIVYVDALNTSVSTIVDISNAATIGDVARYLEAGAPDSSGIRVEVTATGLSISTATPAEGVAIREVSGGVTARDLGIVSTAPQSTITGTDITPELLKTSRIDDLLGTKAQATLVTGSTNNDILIRATQNGERVDPDDPLSDPLNGVTVQLVAGGTAGSETAVYDPVAATLTVTIEPGASTAAQAVEAINAEASGLFTAEIDFRDATSPTQAGQGTLSAGSTAVTSGGSGEILDQSSGLLITNGRDPIQVDISEAETIEDLLNTLNKEELGLHAEINSAGNGINIRSRLSGADLTIGEVSGGSTATQLGVRTLTELTKIEDFNRGVGVAIEGDTTLDIQLTTLGVPTNYEVELGDAISVADVIDEIALQTGGAVTARLVEHGNGIELVDNTGADELEVSGQVAELLGFFDESQVNATSTSGTLAAEDRHTLEVDSAFNTLIRLRDALRNDDFPAIGDEINRIDEDLSRVSFARSEIGARLQNLDTIQTRHEDEEVAIRTALSDEIDVDLTEAITEFTRRQYAMQASLQTAGSLFQLSLLNYI